MSFGPGILFVAFIIFAALAAFYSHRQQTKRREALARLAADLGWRFDASKDRSFDQRYPFFHVFTVGSSRSAYNVLSGAFLVDDVPLSTVMGDYRYTTRSGSGKNRRSQTHRFSFLVMELPILRSPELHVRSENFLDKFAGMMGFDDIDFESVEFSARFHVKCEDKRLAYDVFHPRMIEFMLQSDPPVIAVAHAKCCLHDRGRCWDVEQFRERLLWAEEFFALWPQHVVEEMQQI